MLAAARPGTAWRTNCGEHVNVCLMRQALVVPDPSISMIPEPSVQVWDGKVFWRYVGPGESGSLMSWLVASIQGQAMASARDTARIDPLPLADIQATQPTLNGVVAPTLFQYVRSHGRARSPFHHQESPSIWHLPGEEAPPKEATYHETVPSAGVGVPRHVHTVRLSWSPSIVLLPGFLDDAECDELMDLAQPLLRESSPERTREGTSHSSSDDLSADMASEHVAATAFIPRGAERPDHSETLHNAMQRVHDLIGVPPDHGEPVQVHRYGGVDGLRNIHAAADNTLLYAMIVLDTSTPRIREPLAALRFRADALHHTVRNVRALAVVYSLAGSCCCCRRTHGFSAFLNTPHSGGEIIFPKVKGLDAAERADAPLFAGSDDDLRENFVEICSGLPIAHTDYQNCDELVDHCPEIEVSYDMLKVIPRKGDAVLFMPVRLPQTSASMSPSLSDISSSSAIPPFATMILQQCEHGLTEACAAVLLYFSG
jgi:hypothetical protein